MDKNYKYCLTLLGGVNPVRFLVNENNDVWGAESPDGEGGWKPVPTMLSLRDIKPQEFDNVGQQEFEQKVREYAPKKAVSKIKSDSTIIYSDGYWRVIARCNAASGEITVSSCNCDTEWNVIIPAEGVPDLKSALIKSGATSPENENTSDDCVDLLKQFFGDHQEDPFEEIKRYLKIHGIPSRNSYW